MAYLQCGDAEGGLQMEIEAQLGGGGGGAHHPQSIYSGVLRAVACIHVDDGKEDAQDKKGCHAPDIQSWVAKRD